MFVQVQAVKREGFNGVWRAGRFWPSAEAIRLEVVEEDPPPVQEDVVENGKVVGTRPVPDMTRIGRASLEKLREDGRLSIQSDDETGAVISASIIAESNRQLGEAQDQIIELKNDLTKKNEAVAILTKQVIALTKERDAALARITELEELATAPAKDDGADKTAQSKGQEKGGKAKGDGSGK